jgi:N utilization substance protein A
MTVKFDTETIRLINLFENISGAPVKDCILDSENNTLYFIIEEGKAGMAIGKDGNSVKNAERVMGKSIKIYEFSNDVVTFVKKLIPQCKEVKLKIENDKMIVEIRVETKDKAVVIGRDKRNLKIFKELLQRNHNVNDLMVR